MTDSQFLANLLATGTGGSHTSIRACDVPRAVALLTAVGFIESHRSVARLYMAKGTDAFAFRADIVSNYAGRQIAEAVS